MTVEREEKKGGGGGWVGDDSHHVKRMNQKELKESYKCHSNEYPQKFNKNERKQC